jgi:hypothetical protein
MKPDIVVWKGQAGENQGKMVARKYRQVVSTVMTKRVMLIPKASAAVRITRPTANRKSAI